MILDDREALQHPELERRLEAKVERLEYGDVLLEENDHVVEIKRVPDLLACICDGRFVSEQMPGLLAYRVRTLLVVGEFAAAPNDKLLVLTDGRWESPKYGRTPFWVYREVAHFLADVTAAGVVPVSVRNELEMARWLRAMNTWRPGKSLDRIYMVPIIGVRKPTLKQKFVSILPGVGSRKRKDVEQQFASIREMVNADPMRWEQVPGIAKAGAEKIVAGFDETR